MAVWRYCFEKLFSGIFLITKSQVKIDCIAGLPKIGKVTEFLDYWNLVKLPNYQNFIKLTYWNFVKLSNYRINQIFAEITELPEFRKIIEL